MHSAELLAIGLRGKVGFETEFPTRTDRDSIVWKSLGERSRPKQQ